MITTKYIFNQLTAPNLTLVPEQSPEESNPTADAKAITLLKLEGC